MEDFEGVEYCFNPKDFEAEHFDVDRFVSVSARHVPLLTLRGDLARFVNSLRKDIIGAIEQDYEGLVSISNSLDVIGKHSDSATPALEQAEASFKTAESAVVWFC